MFSYVFIKKKKEDQRRCHTMLLIKDYRLLIKLQYVCNFIKHHGNVEFSYQNMKIIFACFYLFIVTVQIMSILLYINIVYCNKIK
jgi:hypothetical protein